MVGDVIAQVEREILLQAMKLSAGNKAQCARLLHIDYKTIQSKLKEYHISSSEFHRENWVH
jgi:two-component system nitrogen regulation response regulator GlnG